MRPGSRPAPRSEWSASLLTFLLLPVFAFAVTLWILSSGGRGERGTPTPPPGGTGVEVIGLAGTLLGEHGARVEVRLSPLHADPERQRFDAEELREHFGIEHGEPWRLEIAYVGDPARDAADQPVLDLSRIEVRDADGRAMTGVLDAARVEGLAGDPLAVLLRRSRATLAAGESTQRVLWGEVPGERARVTGLFGAEDAPLFPRTDAATELALSPASLRQDRELALFQAEVARAPRAGEDE